MTRSPMEVLSSLPVGMCSATEAIHVWSAMQRLVEEVKSLCSGLPVRHEDLAAVLGNSNAATVIRLRDAVACMETAP